MKITTHELPKLNDEQVTALAKIGELLREASEVLAKSLAESGSNQAFAAKKEAIERKIKRGARRTNGRVV